MGLFGALVGSSKAKKKRKPTAAAAAPAKQPPRQDDTRIQTAVLGPVICAMVADREVNQAEIVQLSTMCTLSPVFAGFPTDQVNELIQAVMEDVGKRKAEAVVMDAAQALSPALRETAFAYAVRMVVADGVLNSHELAAIDLIRNWLTLETARAAQIQEVTLIMMRPATA